ncbi:MAG: protein arginine kinase [Fuerstiella sp.]|nr:protein arginine kinase [Fuerstiella sp.]
MSADDKKETEFLDDLAKSSGAWLRGDGPDADIVVSSRIRLARNVAGFPFMAKADDDVRLRLVETLRSAVTAASSSQNFQFLNIALLEELDAQLLMERQLISRELADMNGPRGVIVGPGEHVSVMLNEEDHLRIQVLQSGYALKECWKTADELDTGIEKSVTYAFDEEFGYLTACPTNVGTGIRVSVMMHLPGLRMTREIQKVNQAAQKINLAVRGLYGEGSQALGDFFQISNQMTLGCPEQELIDNMMEVVPQIVGYERRVRDLLCRENRQALDDKISRARAILTGARSISSDETMHLLSNLRMGINLGIIEDISIGDVNALFVHTQPSHLQKLHGGPLKTAERNAARAGFLRNRLGSL